MVQITNNKMESPEAAIYRRGLRVPGRYISSRPQVPASGMKEKKVYDKVIEALPVEIFQSIINSRHIGAIITISSL